MLVKNFFERRWLSQISLAIGKGGVLLILKGLCVVSMGCLHYIIQCGI